MVVQIFGLLQRQPHHHALRHVQWQKTRYQQIRMAGTHDVRVCGGGGSRRRCTGNLACLMEKQQLEMLRRNDRSGAALEVTRSKPSHATVAAGTLRSSVRRRHGGSRESRANISTHFTRIPTAARTCVPDRLVRRERSRAIAAFTLVREEQWWRYLAWGN